MTTITLGQIFDAVRRVEDAEQELRDAQQSVLYGGNEETMAFKRQRVADAVQQLESVRNEPL